MSYSNIREILGEYIGKTVADITQHDEDDWRIKRERNVHIMFTDGTWIRFPIGDDGFWSGDADGEIVWDEAEEQEAG